MPHLVPPTLTSAEQKANLLWLPITAGREPIIERSLRAIVAEPQTSPRTAVRTCRPRRT